ncbi:hypothetical protein VHEMI07250 [[Torrubiella] hemipterigena]|uniref:Uncharacterized protein n=1 Tax=[Torrubiella] hemipterigena TaxID=1531966 RepID=A0A0A1TLB0_9HYPO|nr:hypothetical protein VHEMI07250 [[Torrubiella] hemipterigena]
MATSQTEQLASTGQFHSSHETDRGQGAQLEQLKVEDGPDQRNPVSDAHRHLFVTNMALWFAGLGILIVGIVCWTQAARHIALGSAICATILGGIHLPLMGPVTRQRSPTDPRPSAKYIWFLYIDVLLWLATTCLLFVQYAINDNVPGDTFTKRDVGKYPNHRDTRLAQAAVAGGVVSILAFLVSIWAIILTRRLTHQTFSAKDVNANWEASLRSYFTPRKVTQPSRRVYAEYTYKRDQV